MSLALLFLCLMLNMFQMLIHPSSGACDLFVELFHGLYCSGSMCVGVTLWFGCGGVVSVCRLRHIVHIVPQPAYRYTTPPQPNHNGMLICNKFSYDIKSVPCVMKFKKIIINFLLEKSFYSVEEIMIVSP